MRPSSARTAASRMRQTEPWSRPRRAEVPSGVARVPMFLTASEVEITGASDHAARAACCSQDAGLGVRRAFLRSDDAQELKPRTTGAPKNAGLTPSKAQAGLAECRFP